MSVINKVTVTRARHFIRIKRMNNIMLLSMQLFFLPNFPQKNAIRLDSVNVWTAQKNKNRFIFTESLHQSFIKEINRNIDFFFDFRETENAIIIQKHPAKFLTERKSLKVNRSKEFICNAFCKVGG